ncbi:MAG: restriction modification system specificity domain [Burkholderiaceae bacterium]|nr:restriction modification system specificity domain [Burkholderiaceae bacterium]
MHPTTGWQTIALDDCFWFQEGPGVRKWQFMNSGIKLLNVANIEKDGKLNLAKTDRHLSVDEVEAKYKHFLLDVGDLVIASSGISFDQDNLLKTRGAFVEKAHLPLCLNTSTIRFKAKDNISDLKFLKHWIDSREFREQITKRVTGSAQQNFGPSHLKELRISLPLLNEQRRIAAILDQADALRAKRREALAQLDELQQAIFMEMFGDPVGNPKKWSESYALGDVADIVSGVTKGRNLNGKNTRIVPYLAVANVQDKALNLSAIKEIEVTDDEIQRYLLKKDDLLLTEGGDPDKLGRGTIWNNELPECIHQNHIFRVRLKTENIEPLFLNWLVGSQRGKNYFLRSAKQTTGIASINMTQLRGFPLLIPPLKLQQEFAETLRNIEKQKNIQHQAQIKLEDLFSSLQYSAFRGEL